ncbi:hypothetical protein EDB19DRAFT_1906176 [Suillus lakei]|nr:hypothetical protein EDB19DRAFT_1906176 [Suillus lakei]
MNVAGPSRPRPIPSPRDNHEEDLTRMIAELGLADVERLQTLYDNRKRKHRGKGPSDREVAFTLLMQNARELAGFNADLALAQRLAVGGDGDYDPTPRPATVVEHAAAPQPAVRNTTSKIQTWSQLLDSFLSTPVSSGQTTPNPNKAPIIATRAPR